MTKKLTFGLIVGNRGFFPDHLAKEGRDEMLAVLEKAGIRAITLTPEESKFGSVETHDDAIRCGDLFRKHRDEIDGIIVTLPNFGDERGIADSIRYSKLNVPDPGAGHARSPQRYEDFRPPRQLLRQDVGLQ